MTELREKLKEATSDRIKKIGRDPVGFHKNKDILEYWNQLGLHKENLYTRTTKKAILCLSQAKRGKLFQKNALFLKYADKSFTEDEIKLSILRFSLAAFDYTCYPEKKEGIQKVSLLDFMYSPYAHTPMTKSFFLFYFEHPPKRIIVDENPALTEKIINLYNKKMYIDEKVGLNSKDKDCFTVAANKLTVFISKNKKNFRMYSKITNSVAAEWLFDAVVNGNTSENIFPSFFSSDKTFLYRLPNYLRKIGVMV